KALKVMRELINWMIRGDRMERDPFRTITLLNEDADPKKRQRRTLTIEELGRLIQAAEKGTPIDSVVGRRARSDLSVCLRFGPAPFRVGTLGVPTHRAGRRHSLHRTTGHHCESKAGRRRAHSSRRGRQTPSVDWSTPSDR